MGATDYKQISIWIGKHIQKEQIKKLLGVEFYSYTQRKVLYPPFLQMLTAKHLSFCLENGSRIMLTRQESI